MNDIDRIWQVLTGICEHLNLEIAEEKRHDNASYGRYIDVLVVRPIDRQESSGAGTSP